MRKLTVIFVAAFALAAAFPALAQRQAERTYISTDKDVYVAGERIWCSAFCVDPATGRLSSLSGTAYLELHSPSGLAASARIALTGGRGAGAVELPAALPTGNYRLIAYTAQNRAERGYDYEGIAAKTVSVFNVLTRERVDDGVKVLSAAEYAALPNPGTDAAGEMDLRWENGRVVVENRSGAPLTLSLSVYHDDGIRSNANPGIEDFVKGVRNVGDVTFDNTKIADYEGEIIRGRVVGFSQEMIPELTGKYAFLSSPSDKSDVYAAPIREDGSLQFFTAGIYGNKECILEIEGVDPKMSCHVELQSPYVNPAVAPAAPLALSESLAPALESRSVAMQLDRRMNADTLFEYLPRRDDGLFDENIVVRYILDDYTRFTTMEEVFTEFIPEIRPRKAPDGTRDIKVRLAEIAGVTRMSTDKTMMMLDGVPVFNQQKIMDYDPLLVESVDIYPLTHFVGNRVFEGIVNFVTYKRNLPSFQFDGNARVVDYQGVCVPMAFTDGHPYRQTVCWQPILPVAPGESVVTTPSLPVYKGVFTVVAEGLSADGKPFCRRISFEVK